MNESHHDPSVEHEPHLQAGRFQGDPSEQAAERALRNSAGGGTQDDHVEHSVWDEPALSPRLAGTPPEGGLTYAGWLQRRSTETSAARSWCVALAVALAAGPWAILGALMTAMTWGGQLVTDVATVVVVAPVTEEMMKVALALWVVEKRPFLFRSRLQIGLCALAGGAVFAVVENFLYLHVYIAEPSPGLVLWRWTVCVALHMGCSAVAGLGLMRVWYQAMQQSSRPQLAPAAPLLVAAMLIHGAYNGFAMLLLALDYNF